MVAACIYIRRLFNQVQCACNNGIHPPRSTKPAHKSLKLRYLSVKYACYAHQFIQLLLEFV